MNFFTSIFLILCAVASPCLQAKQCPCFYPLDRCQTPHKFFAGASVFGSSVKTEVDLFDIHGNRCFGGYLFGYEYLKPDQFYVHIEGGTGWSSCFSVSQNKVLLPKQKSYTTFNEIFLRLGYPLTRSNWIIAPFFSASLYSFNAWFSSKGFSENFPFLGGGLHCLYQPATSFSIGFDCEFFGNTGIFSGSKKYSPHPEQNFNSSGGRFSLPLTWYFFGNYKPRELCFEPYLINLSFNERQFVYGASLKIGTYL